MARIQDYIIGIAVAILIASALIPTAFTNFFNANTTGWDASTKTMWNLIPLMVVLGIVVLVIGVAVSRRKGSGV